MQVKPLTTHSPFHARLARGHEIRKGHALHAVEVSQDGILWHTVRLCCGETIPDTVSTWNDATPQPDKPRTGAYDAVRITPKDNDSK